MSTDDFARLEARIEALEHEVAKLKAKLAKPARVKQPRHELSPERQEVLNLLKDQPGLTVKEVTAVLNRVKSGTARLMSDMKADGLIRTVHGAWFVVEG